MDLSGINARKSISEHSLREEIKELIEKISNLDDESLTSFGSTAQCFYLRKVEKGASPVPRRNIRNDVVDYFVTIQDELRLLEQRDQAAVKMLLNQVNTYFWAMHSEHPDNKDAVFNYIAQWISAKSGKSMTPPESLLHSLYRTARSSMLVPSKFTKLEDSTIFRMHAILAEKQPKGYSGADFRQDQRKISRCV